MPEVRDYFSHLAELPEHELKIRREVLVESMPEDYEQAEDETLAELFAITRMLVNKSKTPVRKKAAKKPQAPATDLFKDMI